MKRTVAIALALLLALAAAACGGKKPNNPPDSTGKQIAGSATPKPGETPGADDGYGLSYSALYEYARTGDKSCFQPRILTPAEQQELKESVEAEGAAVTFDPDGTIRITGPGSVSFAVHPDGSAEGIDENGNPFNVRSDGSWPDSAFGKAVPEADFPVSFYSEDSESLAIVFKNVPLEKAKAYGAKLREAGFTVGANEAETDGGYRYSGRNDDDLLAVFIFDPSGDSSKALLYVGRYSPSAAGTPGPEDTEGPGKTPGPGGTDGPADTGDPDVSAEIPATFRFLFPGGTGAYQISRRDGSVTAKNEKATVETARQIIDALRGEKYDEYYYDEWDNSDGSSSFEAVYRKDGREVSLSYYMESKGITVVMIENAKTR